MCVYAVIWVFGISVYINFCNHLVNLNILFGFYKFSFHNNFLLLDN